MVANCCQGGKAGLPSRRGFLEEKPDMGDSPASHEKEQVLGMNGKDR